MKTTEINFDGIVRAGSNQKAKNGWLDELINARMMDGKYQPVLPGTKLYEIPPGSFEKYWHHSQDNVDNYVAMDNLKRLFVVNLGSGVSTLIKEYSSKIYVTFIKRFMIVVHATGMDRFIWRNGSYQFAELTERPEFSLYTSGQSYNERKQENINVADTMAQTLRGWFYDHLNNISADGFMTGGMFVRAAIKLFDGSYVLHTIPRFIAVNNFEIGIYRDKGSLPDMFKVGFTTAKLNIMLLKNFYETNYSSIKELIQGISVFATAFQPIIKWDETKDDNVKDILVSMPFGPSTAYLNTEITDVNPEFKEMCDSPSWYLIGEYSMTKLLESDVNEEIDLKNFYQDYATRETLPLDQFSHHLLYAGHSFNFISRLILSNVSTKFGDYRYFPIEPILDGSEYPNIAPNGFNSFGTRYVRLLTTIETDSGTIFKLGRQSVRNIYNNTSYPVGSVFVCIGLGEIGYPDARAKRIDVLVSYDGNDWYKMGGYNLVKSKYDNYAYYANTNFTTAAFAHTTGAGNFSAIMHKFVDNIPVNLSSYPDKDYNDTNRIQVSEVNNPFYYPAKYSYIVGTQTVLASASNTEPLSTGQFGEYPLVCFCSDGLYSLYQGDGANVLFTKVVPVGKEIADNIDNIIPVKGGVVFSTALDLNIIIGNNVQSISALLHGNPNFDLQGVATYGYRLSHINLVTLKNQLSAQNFKLYKLNSLVSYDAIHDELLVTKPNSGYSYVYSFKSASWHKISRSYSILINAYPKLYAVQQFSSNDGIYSLSDEQLTGNVHVLISTRPVKLENNAAFSLIHRIFMRCEIQTPDSSFAGFYVFASNDLHTWQLMQGSDKRSGEITDILCTRSHQKAKYFVFVFASVLKENSSLNSIQVQHYPKLTQKIR